MKHAAVPAEVLRIINRYYNIKRCWAENFTIMPKGYKRKDAHMAFMKEFDKL